MMRFRWKQNCRGSDGGGEPAHLPGSPIESWSERIPRASPEVSERIRSLFSTLRIEIPSPALAGLQGASILDAASRNRFIDRLKTLGELKGIDAAEIYKEGTVIEIRIVKQVQRN